MWSSRRWARPQLVARQMSWKHILVWALCGHLLRYVLVTCYCFLCHMTIYRWASCANDHLHPKSFSQTAISLLASGSGCGGGESVLVYVPSPYSHFQRRQLIRDTWVKNLLKGPLKAKFVFVLGIPTHQQSAEYPQLQAELSKFDDIILVDIIDHYYNLTQKTRAIFNWTIENCPHIHYLIRADADIVLNARILYRFVHDHIGIIPKVEPIVFGHCRAYDCITRLPSSKSCLPLAFYENIGRPLFYPSYCLGFSGIVSMEYARRATNLWRLSMQSQGMDYLPMEDLHTIGYTGQTMGAWKVGNRKLFVFDKYFDSFSCQTGPIASAAYEDEEEMRLKWATYQERCQHF